MADGTCVIEGCDKPRRARNWCPMHYSRWQRHGDPLLYGSRIVGDDLARFWAYVDRSNADGCWPWTGGLSDDEYGVLKIDGRMVKATRWLFDQTHDVPLAADEVARHTCDNPPCVRHIIRGTVADNSADQVERDRTARGGRNAKAKLTDDAVRALRARHAAGEKQVVLARDFGISTGLVCKIIHRRNWVHVI